MTFEMYGDVILTRDVPESGLRAGDVGTVVERHAMPGISEEGYSIEFFDMTGNTVGVVTLPASALRLPHDSRSPRRVRGPKPSPSKHNSRSFPAYDLYDFTHGADDRVWSFFGHAVAAVRYKHLASATGPLRELSLKIRPSLQYAGGG